MSKIDTKTRMAAGVSRLDAGTVVWRRKRAIDVSLAALFIVFTTPIMLSIAMAIRFSSAGPILFRQERTGLNGKNFIIFKFRTMRHARTATSSFQQALPGDKRVTKVGRYLRKTSLDELPQLFNVLNGTMSLVGPRPHPVELDAWYASHIVGYGRRFAVKPGITGWAQVNGSRGATPTLGSMRRRVELDLHYIANWSLLLDFSILLRTSRLILQDANAY